MISGQQGQQRRRAFLGRSRPGFNEFIGGPGAGTRSIQVAENVRSGNDFNAIAVIVPLLLFGLLIIKGASLVK